MSTFLTRFSLIASLILTAVFPAGAQTEDARLETFFKHYLNQRFALQPLEATRLGDHRFDTQMEIPTAGARAQWLDLTKKTLAALPQAVDYKKFSRTGQIDFEIFQHDLRAELADGEHASV